MCRRRMPPVRKTAEEIVALQERNYYLAEKRQEQRNQAKVASREISLALASAGYRMRYGKIKVDKKRPDGTPHTKVYFAFASRYDTNEKTFYIYPTICSQNDVPSRAGARKAAHEKILAGPDPLKVCGVEKSFSKTPGFTELLLLQLATRLRNKMDRCPLGQPSGNGLPASEVILLEYIERRLTGSKIYHWADQTI